MRGGSCDPGMAGGSALSGPVEHAHAKGGRGSQQCCVPEVGLPGRAGSPGGAREEESP